MTKELSKHARALLQSKKDEVIKVDLGCGPHRQPGFIGIDIEKHPNVDIVHDLEVFPWPLPDNCAMLVLCGHLVEHINPHKGTFIKFMNEAWRILKYDGQFFVSTPYAGSRGYWADPTHVNPCSKDTWSYFDPMQKQMYDIYRPLPWKVEKITMQAEGNMEVLLVKRRIDKSYHVNPAYLKGIKL
jgi:predicted SAM-dependent methyltransferase